MSFMKLIKLLVKEHSLPVGRIPRNSELSLFTTVLGRIGQCYAYTPKNS
jgi:hypothetical protein